MNTIVNKGISIRNFIIITSFAILIGIITIYIATKGFIKVNILKSYKRGIAEINYSMIDTTKHSSSESLQNDIDQIKVKYFYFVDNNKFEGECVLWWKFIFNSNKNVKVGDKIDIFYNIDNPSKSEIYHISYVWIVIGIILIVFPILALKQRIKSN